MGATPLSRKRLALRLALGLVTLLAILLGFSATEAALQWSARLTERLSGGQLELRGVRGSLYGPVQVEGISFTAPTVRVEVQALQLEWGPRALLDRRIRIDHLALAELRISELEPATEPVSLPASLQLPVRVSIASLTVGRVLLKTGAGEQVLSDLVLGLEARDDKHALDLRRITTPWGVGQAKLELGAAPPFLVAGQLGLEQRAPLPYRFEAKLAGDLNRLLATATARVQGMNAEITATLAPFEKMPLVQARVTAQDIDPAAMRKDLPQAELAVRLSVARQGAAQLEGDLAISNALAGPLDRARLPLQSVTARFSGTPKQLDLSQIELDLAMAGKFAGTGSLANEQVELKLGTRNFDPHGVHSKQRPMQLAGDIHLRADAQSQQLEAALGYQGVRFLLDAGHRDNAVELRRASLQANGGKLDAHGSLLLDATRQLKLAGTLQEFNPADFGDYPAASINASFSATGKLAEKPEAQLEFAIAGSRFRNQALSGKGRLSLSPQRIWDSDIALRLARNQLELKGGLGAADDRLAFRIEADQLELFDANLTGKVRAAGNLAGTLAAPSGNFEVQASRLSWRKQNRLADLRASGRLDQGVDGPLLLEASLQGLDLAGLRLDQVNLHAQGTRAAHALQVLVNSSALPLELVGIFSGGWHETEGWSGQIAHLENRGRHEFLLKQPATLAIAARRFVLGAARFDFLGADLDLRETSFAAGRVASQGEFKALPLARLQALAAPDLDLASDLTLGGAWRFVLGDTFNGHLAAWREQGDVTLPSVPRTTLGLSQLTLNAAATNNKLQGRMVATGVRLGSLHAGGQLELAQRDGIWGIAADAPLQAGVELDVQSMAWIAPLLDRKGALNFDGALVARAQLEGSLARPRMTGTLSGQGIDIAISEQGLRLSNGAFHAELQDRELQLKKLTLRGGDGTLAAQGKLVLDGKSPRLQLSLQAERLELLARPDRHLILSGSGDVSSAENHMQLRAKLKADRGLIELPKGGGPQLSDDVVVLGRAEASAAADQKPAARVDLDLELDLGDNFYLKGHGLDAQLAGAIKLASSAGAVPSARGSIRVVKGAYAAYGQRLDIERGILNFQGPIDNPGLNILALRKNQAVEAGVAVTGTAQAPRVTLASNPVVRDSEKLSWLVLGHGTDDTSAEEFVALQAAAGALLAAGESVTLQQQIAQATGLDDVSLKGAGRLEGTMLTLGKRLSARTYLSYEQALTGVGTLMKINYALTERISAQAQAGSSPALDLFYKFSFD
jgi:translocation and assembly module TamB